MTSRPRARRRTAARLVDRPAWDTLAPRTLAHDAIEAIVAAAARGVLLPGDRIVEAEVASTLGISRIPVREALRALETQGVVTSEPHKGFRLMEVTRDHIHQLLEVRLALEMLAVERAVEAGRNRDQATEQLERALAAMESASHDGDAYRLAVADTEFHRVLCSAGGNQVLLSMWEGLSRQLTIVFGLAALEKSAPQILREHRLVIAAFADADRAEPDSMHELDTVLREHLVTQIEELDLDRLIEARRVQRATLGTPGSEPPPADPT